MPRRRATARVLSRHVVPAAVAALYLLPLWYLVAGSLRPLDLPPPRGAELLPPDVTVEAFGRLGELLPIWTFLRNSVLVSAVAVPISVLVAALAGFAIRTMSPRAARRAVVAVVAVTIIPVSTVWATRFDLFDAVGLTDSFVPVVAPALLAANPLYALLYAWAFTRVPDSQLESARLDGAGELTVFRRVALPQVRATTLAVVVLTFAFHWANFADPLLYLHGIDRFTLPLGLRFLQQLNPTDWPLLMAGSLVFTLPVVAVLVLAQRVMFEDPRIIVGRSAP